QLVDPETAEQLADNVEPEQVAPPVAGSCLAQTDLSQVPNPVAGYGIVNAYAAVEQALAERTEGVGPGATGQKFDIRPALADVAGKPPSNSPQRGENRLTSPPLGGIEGGLLATPK